jgi:preprotein translocase subunit SecG
MELDVLETLVMVVHVLAALGIIGLVLIQHGKGADMGSGFGGGASNTVFGSGGSGNFLTRATTTIAIAFFVTSFGLAFFAKQHSVEARNVGIPTVSQESTEIVQPIMVDEIIDSEIPVAEDPATESEIPES